MSDDQDRLVDDWERERKALLKEDEDHYTGPRSIADTLEELKKLYPAIPRALHTFATGATSSTDVDGLRYDLISPVGLEAVAKVMAKGARTHGEHNWLKGIAVHDNLCHAIHHFYRYLSGDRSEDHLGNATARGLMAIHSEKMWPHLNAGHLCGPGCTPPVSPITEVEF